MKTSTYSELSVESGVRITKLEGGLKDAIHEIVGFEPTDALVVGEQGRAIGLVENPEAYECLCEAPAPPPDDQQPGIEGPTKLTEELKEAIQLAVGFEPTDALIVGEQGRAAALVENPEAYTVQAGGALCSDCGASRRCGPNRRQCITGSMIYCTNC